MMRQNKIKPDKNHQDRTGAEGVSDSFQSPLSSHRQQGSFFWAGPVMKQGVPVQTQLILGPAGDQYEQEADRVADKVMRMPEPGETAKPFDHQITPLVQREIGPEEEEEKTDPGGEVIQGSFIQRRDEEPEEEKEDVAINLKPKTSPALGSKAAPNIASGIPSLKGGGQPLTAPVRNFFEPRFGTDFRRVRIHTGSKAGESAKSINAKAYTTGNNIVFGAGQYSPDSSTGKHLLAHELTHVLQQTRTVAKAHDKGIQVNKTGDVRIQGGFFKKLKRGLSAIGRGIKKGAGYAWEGIKTVGKVSWSITKAVGKWGWRVMKSAGAWVWDLVTETPERIWRILKHIGSGIVGIVSWVWSAFKKALGHIWSAVKGIFNWVGRGIVGFFSWIWKGLKGAGKWGWRLINGDFSGFWDGIAGFFSWIGEGAERLVKWSWDGLKGAVIWAWDGVKGIGKWLLEGIKSGAAWAGRFIAKLLDLVGFGEIMDLLWQIIKFNTRELNSIEKEEAEKVFGNSISYWQVRIDEYSLIAYIGSLFSGGGDMGVVTFHTINFTRKINPRAGNNDMGWLIHELAHVWQMEHIGMQYMGEAIYAQSTSAGYIYGVDDDYTNNDNGASLARDRVNGNTLASFNREQQADIAKHYYMRLSNNLPVQDWQPYIDEFRQ